LELPVTLQALGKTALLEIVTRAQGPDVLTEVALTRQPLTSGGVARVERIPVEGRIDPALNVLLEGRERVRVPQMERVFIVAMGCIRSHCSIGKW
jgi:hypothetical protein